jgi:hypothetical protein
MNEQDIRALVREAIERHLGRPGRSEDGSRHPSHILLNVLPGSDVDEGACVIEPAVRCNHCGFCQSYGH